MTDRFLISRTMQKRFLADSRGPIKSEAATSRNHDAAKPGNGVRAQSEIGILTGKDLGNPSYA